MARRPTQSGFAPVSLHVIPGKGASSEPLEEERTTIDPGPPQQKVSADDGWDDVGTSVDDGGSIDTTSRGDVGHSTVDEPTVEDQARPLPPLSLVPPLPKPAAPKLPGAKLVVIAGNDTGREFVLDPTRPLTIGRAIDNDVVLTDIAVSRKHLDLAFDGEYWVLRDRGSGNGSLVNDRIEDGSCRLHQGDRVEIGNTVFRFEHPGASAPAPQLGWGQGGDDDEASTVAGRSPRQEAAAAAAAKADAIATVPVQKARAGAIDPAPGRQKKPTLPPPSPSRDRSPASTQPPLSSGERLVLPAMPPGASESGRAVMRPSSVIDSAVPQSQLTGRHLTTTARVEPRSFHGASPAYPFVVRQMTRARKYALVGGIVAGVLAIGVIAKVTSKEAPAVSAAAVSPATVVVPQVKTVVVPVPAPIIEPTPAPTPPPPPVPAPAPAPKIATPTPAPAPVAVAPAPTPKVVPLPPPPKTTPKIAPQVAVAPAPKVAPPPPAPRPKTPPRVATSRPQVETSRPKTSPPPRDDSSDALPRSTPKSTIAAKKKAAQQYADGDFAAAAATLRTTADSIDPNDAVPLRALAGEYEAVGQEMANGAAAASRPVDAFNAYARALVADRRAGGAQGAEIRDKLADLAPKAAASYMAKANYEAAKRAADAAADFGSGSTGLVQQVRSSLEKKAGEFLVTAQKMMPNAPEDAKGLLRRILKMVAPDSPSYQKAYQLLNARPKPRDDDE